MISHQKVQVKKSKEDMIYSLFFCETPDCMNKIPPPAPCPWLTAPKLTWLPRGIGGGGGTGGVALVLASFPHKTKGEKSRTFSSSVGARLTQESLLSQAAAAAPIFLGDLCDTHSAFTFGSGRPFEKRRGKKTESKDRSKFSWPLSGRRLRASFLSIVLV